ncbi:MAG TPA: UDP-3-O-acyl-N-acetylglucosamine deacetylase [bacterium]|nr:UDP-3-O-acyl-N-acetylglucosamine deacetylase [bacterium]
MKQTTIARSASFRGIGLHTGREVSMRIEPSEAGTGIFFEYSGAQIRASIENAVVSPRNTELKSGDVTLFTVEHVLAALFGMGVDNARVVLDAPEPPVLDGSALGFATVIKESGIVSLESELNRVPVEKPLIFSENGATILFLPSDVLKMTYFLDHPHEMIGRQSADYVHSESMFLDRIAPARTFGLIEEVEALHNAGLALGGSLENAVVVYPDRYSSELRFENEFARHKLLDMIGDMSLMGRGFSAHCVGIKSGHASNIKSLKTVFGQKKH